MADKGPNYKDTLNLPHTNFPMRGGLVESEPLRLQKWESINLYEKILSAREDKQGEKFILHDGPPFANGDVHMGTALNKLLKDLVIKSKSMSGYVTPYIPGWDCHGLPIEYKVVEKAQGLEPGEIRRRCEDFALNFVNIQRESFKRLGVLAAWNDPYLTLEPKYEADIIRAFSKFIEKGLVYSSRKPVQWSFGAQTALAEAEVEYKDITDTAIFVKFELESGPLTNQSSLVIWTTTPWTLPANLAIALNEKIEYINGEFKDDDQQIHNLIIAKDLVESFEESTGLRLIKTISLIQGSEFKDQITSHPFLPRKSPIIFADFVTTDAGTGAVHIAPGHGGDDYLAGQAAGLSVLSPVDDLGNYTEEVGISHLVGKHVLKSNNDIIELLEEKGCLIGQEEYTHSYPHCWRSKTPIIFRAVPQFFISINSFRNEALKEIDSVQWLPQKNRNRIYGTVEARPDWCISRQRTWGVPLPIFYDADGEPIIDAENARKIAEIIEDKGSNVWFENDDLWWTNELGIDKNYSRCGDTLDVWIDSGTSHIAVCDRHPELKTPADLYLEATDQHRGWFQSSLMISMVTKGMAPYKSVLTHGFVVDQDTGKKVSKSDQSNNDSKKKKKVKPMEADHFVSKFGADILRLWVASVDWETEVPFGEGLFKQTADTYRRIRNTFRILLGNLNDFDPNSDTVDNNNLSVIDKWILERLHKTTCECLDGYKNYQFRKVFNSINNFCTNDLSSIYIDITKDRMYCDLPNSLKRRSTQSCMHKVFNDLCKLLAPILSFTADEAWEHAGNHPGDIHCETFPEPDPSFKPGNVSEHMEILLKYRNIIQQSIEPLRQEKVVRSNYEASVELSLSNEDPDPIEFIGNQEDLHEFFMVSELSTVKGNDEVSATTVKSNHPKCPRCWRLMPSNHPDNLCKRCEDAVNMTKSTTH